MTYSLCAIHQSDPGNNIYLVYNYPGFPICVQDPGSDMAQTTWCMHEQMVSFQGWFLFNQIDNAETYMCIRNDIAIARSNDQVKKIKLEELNDTRPKTGCKSLFEGEK